MMKWLNRHPHRHDRRDSSRRSFGRPPNEEDRPARRRRRCRDDDDGDGGDDNAVGGIICGRAGAGMEGYLEKRASALLRKYQERWFVRQGRLLKYYVRKGDAEPKLSLYMPDCIDVRLTNSDSEQRQFEIEFPDRILRLRAPSKELCVAWVANLKVWTKKGKQGFPIANNVWKGIGACIEYCDRFGLRVPGLLKDSGRHDAVDSFVMNIRVEGDRFFPSDASNEFMTLTPVEVACGLKRLLRDLPESILTEQLFDKFIDIPDAASLRILIETLPRRNRDILSNIILLCTHLIENSDANGASISDLALSLGPSIVGHAGNQLADLTDFVKVGVRHGHLVFGHPVSSTKKRTWDAAGAGSLMQADAAPVIHAAAEEVAEDTPIMSLDPEDFQVETLRTMEDDLATASKQDDDDDDDDEDDDGSGTTIASEQQDQDGEGEGAERPVHVDEENSGNEKQLDIKVSDDTVIEDNTADSSKIDVSLSLPLGMGLGSDAADELGLNDLDSEDVTESVNAEAETEEDKQEEQVEEKEKPALDITSISIKDELRVDIPADEVVVVEREGEEDEEEEETPQFSVNFPSVHSDDVPDEDDNVAREASDVILEENKEKEEKEEKDPINEPPTQTDISDDNDTTANKQVDSRISNKSIQVLDEEHRANVKKKPSTDSSSAPSTRSARKRRSSSPTKRSLSPPRKGRTRTKNSITTTTTTTTTITPRRSKSPRSPASSQNMTGPKHHHSKRAASKKHCKKPPTAADSATNKQTSIPSSPSSKTEVVRTAEDAPITVLNLSIEELAKDPSVAPAGRGRARLRINAQTEPRQRKKSASLSGPRTPISKLKRMFEHTDPASSNHEDSGAISIKQKDIFINIDSTHAEIEALVENPATPENDLRKHLLYMKQQNVELERELRKAHERRALAMEQCNRLNEDLHTANRRYEQACVRIESLSTNPNTTSDDEQAKALIKRLETAEHERDEALRCLDGLHKSGRRQSRQLKSANLRLNKDLEDAERQRRDMETQLEHALEEKYTAQTELNNALTSLERQVLHRDQLVTSPASAPVGGTTATAPNTTGRSSGSELSDLRAKVSDLKERLANLRQKRQNTEEALRKERARTVYLEERSMKLESNEVKMRHEKIELRKKVRQAHLLLEELRETVVSEQTNNESLRVSIEREAAEHNAEVSLLEKQIQAQIDTVEELKKHVRLNGSVDSDVRESSSISDANHALELQLDAIRSRVESRLANSREALLAIENRAKIGLQQSSSRLSQLERELTTLSSETAADVDADHDSLS